MSSPIPPRTPTGPLPPRKQLPPYMAYGAVALPFLAWATLVAEFASRYGMGFGKHDPLFEWSVVFAALGLTLGAAELITGTRHRKLAIFGLVFAGATLLFQGALALR